MKAIIYCRPTAKGIHSFYMAVGKDSYYLFSQPYRKGVDEYFRKGVVIDRALKFSKSRNDAAILRTMTKLPVYIKYIEKEFDIQVLEQTKKKAWRNKKRKCA